MYGNSVPIGGYGLYSMTITLNAPHCKRKLQTGTSSFEAFVLLGVCVYVCKDEEVYHSIKLDSINPSLTSLTSTT